MRICSSKIEKQPWKSTLQKHETSRFSVNRSKRLVLFWGLKLLLIKRTVSVATSCLQPFILLSWPAKMTCKIFELHSLYKTAYRLLSGNSPTPCQSHPCWSYLFLGGWLFFSPASRSHSPDRTSLWPFSPIFRDLPSGEDVKPCSIILKLWQTAKFKRLWRSLRPAQFIHHNLPAPVWMINWKSVFSFVLGDLACHYRLFATRGKLWKFGFLALSK